MADFEPIVAKWMLATAQLDGENRMGVPLDSVKEESISVRDVSNGNLLKIMVEKAPGKREEAVFTTVGQLVDCDLPPITWKIVKKAVGGQVLQRAAVTGFKSAPFLKGLEILSNLETKLGAAVPRDIPVKATCTTYAENVKDVALVTSTRYFTRARKPIPASDRRPIPSTVDPHGLLARSENEKTAFCTDNIVHYVKLVDNQIVVKDPSSFAVGDLIQLGFAMHAYRMFDVEAGPSFVIKLVLRSLLYLDTPSATKPENANTVIKRKLINDTYEEQHAKRLRRAANPLADRVFAEVIVAPDSSDDEDQGGLNLLDLDISGRTGN
ncbi:hypothetical protein MIND_00150900 [Mycena indigotica]|uniref:Uncharacterized protein n=1 Tax=Mycena indigotica TaxID=2126181 RepID=A0A8H6WGV7_9AGAR|nr:uncharacterized protein MIND_00150900 [Mycena indigotica]KAF7316321.1 hypothetical protein MIND_00150900 [Mycena indigotica]